jgi:fatty acid/phospholipid biosynthesis enzyme
VVVCDGFVGNALLKFAESVGQVITHRHCWRQRWSGVSPASCPGEDP